MLKVLKYALTVTIFIILVCAFAIFVLDIPLPWKAQAAVDEPARPAKAEAELETVQLLLLFTDQSPAALRAEAVPDSVLSKLDPLKGKMLDRQAFRKELANLLDKSELTEYQAILLTHAAKQSHTLTVPETVRTALGARHGNKDNLASAKVPKDFHPLVMPGSTALDPGRIVRARIRFAPAETVKIAEARDNPSATGASRFREIRPGDPVKEGDELAVLFSADVGNKKNDLFEAIIQYRLDKIVLDRAQKQEGSLPEVFLWNARRNVQTDRSGIIRAKNTLKIWNIAEEDIEAVVKEANAYDLVKAMNSTDDKEAEWGARQEKWARVVLRSPATGVIIERNVSRGEVIIDNTLNLFTIAQLDRLAVLANIPEDDLPTLLNLKPEQKKWTVQTVGLNSVKGLAGTIDEIGVLIDPNQHTAIVKGYIDNPDGKIRAGQFVSTTVQLPPPPGVVEIPANAIVEDGRQSIVFVRTDPAQDRYTMRRVWVTHRLDNVVLVRSTPFAEAEQRTPQEKEEGLLPRHTLQTGDTVLVSGALELKAAFQEQETRGNR